MEATIITVTNPPISISWLFDNVGEDGGVGEGDELAVDCVWLNPPLIEGTAAWEIKVDEEM